MNESAATAILPTFLKTFGRSTAGLALVVALAATAAASGLWTMAPKTRTALDWALYDFWTAGHASMPADPSIVLVTRDAASDARFGEGSLDRAVFARLLTAISRAGAEAIGLDVVLDRSKPPVRGGASSDAILIEATRAAGRVVYPLRVSVARAPNPVDGGERLIHAGWPILSPGASGHLLRVELSGDPWPALGRDALAIGHDLDSADPDGVVRRMRVVVRHGDRAIPAFGLALAASFLDVAPQNFVVHKDGVTLRNVTRADGGTRHITIPADRDGQILIGPPAVFPSHSMMQVWNAINRGDSDVLREWFADRLVLILSDRHESNPEEPVSVAHARALNTMLSQAWIRETSPLAVIVITVVLSWAGAWLFLSVRPSVGPAVAGAAGVAYFIAAPAALWMGHVVLPVVLPLSTLLLAGGSAVLWTRAAAGREIAALHDRMSGIQRELAGARDQLIARESLVEGLEEDMEAARAAVTRSAGEQVELTRAADTLRGQLAEAASQEAATRRTLEKLERELAAVRTVAVQPVLNTAELEELAAECRRFGVLTQDEGLLRAFRDLKKAARSSLSVLLLGEPGTGKELFARAVHALSARTTRPFVAINMAAIAPDLVESELFGHARGSFTGAMNDRLGYFQQAHGGTLFLDEIGDLRPDFQAKLLRVLQEHTFHRVGDPKPISIDVRIVAATNRDLDRGVAEGWFREDLYFRLKGFVMHLPPLRERPHDILLLPDWFVRRAGAALRKSVQVSREGAEALQRHRWKGNVRELQQSLDRAVALCEGPAITEADLGLDAGPARGSSTTGASTPGMDVTGDLAVLRCLREHAFDMQATARSLGWDRSTVTQRLKGLCFRALVEAKGDFSEAALSLAGKTAFARTVAMKLRDYHDHLIKTIQVYPSAEDAVAACKKRFKNLPDRHFKSVEALVQQYFNRKSFK
jgi:DNA-binding NtrC family response regulator/CHASE2 domain-containing sensor protein